MFLSKNILPRVFSFSRIASIYVEYAFEIVFIINFISFIRRFRLEHSCLVDTENAMQEADVIGVLHDVSNQYTKFKLDPKILRLLYHYSQKHSFLILNKVIHKFSHY